MGFSVVNRKVSSSDRTWAPSRRVTGAGRGAPCSAISSVSVAKRRRGLVVLAIVACLLTGAVAQREGSPVAPFQTPQGAREVPSSSSVSPRSTEAPWMVEPGLQTPPTDTQLHTVDPAVRTSGPSGDPIKASGLLISSSPEGKNRSEVLDPATSSWGVALAETDPSLGTPSKGLGESTDILQPGGSGEEGLFPTPSPTSPGLPDVGGSSRSTVTSSDTAVGFDHPKAAADFTSIQPPASEGGLAGEEDLPGTSQPLAYMAPTTHLGQKSTSHRGDVLPYAQTDFPAYQVVEDASVSPEMIRTSLSPPNLLLGTVPPEATRVVTDVFHSSRGVTAQSFSESVLRVSTGTSPASLPTRSPGVSSRSVTSIQEAVLNGQGPGVTEPATGSALGSPAVPAATARSSDWPFSSSSHTTLPDVVTQAAPMESEGLITHRLSRQQLVPTSVGSPELGDGTALSMSAHGAPATAEVDMEASPSRTSQMEISEAHSGVGEDTVPLASGSAMISPLASKETVGRLSTPQDFPGLEVSSGFFPGSSASFPATPAPRTDPLSSSWAARQMERGLTTQSPHLSPPVSPTVSFLRSAGPLGLERVAADNSTGAVLSTYRRATLGEGSPHLGSTSWARLPASLGTTEQQEGFPTTRGPSPGEGTGREQKERVSSTAEPSPDVSRHTSILDGPSLSTSLEVRSRFRPTETSSLLTLRAAPTAELTTDVPGHTSILDGHREPTRVDVSSKFHSTDASSLPTFMVSPTAEPSPDVPGHTSVLDVQNESTSLDVSSHVHPTDASSLPTFRVSPTAEPSPDVPEHTSILDGQSTPHDISSRFHPTDSSSRGVEIVYAIPSLPPSTSSSTFNALPSADVTDWGSHREATQLELHDGTGPITAATREGPEKISELPLSVSSLGSLSNITPALLGVPTAWKHPALSTERTSSTSSPPPGSILLTTPLSNVSTTVSRASLPSQLLDVAGAAQPFQTTAGGTHHVEEVIGSLSSSPKGELSNGTPVEWRLHLPTLSQAGAERTDGMETSRAIDASMGFSVRSTSYGRSSQASASRSYVETESAVMPQPNITQTVSLSPTATAVSPLSSTKDLQASSSIPPTTQAVSHPSSTEDLLASSRILPMTQAMSPSSFTNDLPASSSIPPTTQAVSLSSSAKDLLASSSILLTTQAVSSASSTTGLLASSSILPTTQAVSPSSSTKDLLATSRILPTMQAVSPSSSAKDLPASSSILPTTQVMSPSSSTKDLPASSSILPTTQAMSPSSSAKDLLASSSILPTTQAVSSASSTTGLPATSRILPTTQAVSPSSSAKDLPGSSSILPTTQAVTPSSSAKDLLASSSILPTTQAVTPSSSAKDLLASSSILPTTQAMSPSSSAKDLPASSSILPTTQAISPSSSTTDLPASSRIHPTTQAVSSTSSASDPLVRSTILPTTQAVSPSSAKGPPASSSILPTTQAVSPSSSATDPQASSRIFPTVSVLTMRTDCSDVRCQNNTQPASFALLPRTSSQLPMTSPTLPPKTLVTTLGSTVGTIGTMGGSSKVDTQKDLTALTGTKPGSMTRDGPSSKHRVSSPRASTVGHTAERDNITLSRRMLGVSILSLDFHLTKIEYTESLANRSSARFKKLEGEVILTLNKMLSFYETFLRADVLRFLNGSVIAQAEALFRGEGLLPTPSDTIRTIVTAVEQREADAFDWQVDLKSLHCNGFGLENLDPEVLAISFTLLGEGSIATFGGLTDWGPLENLRNEVVRSLGARYGVQNFSLGQVRNVQGDLDINGDIYVDTAARVDVGWALEALKGLVKFSVDLGSICINGSKLSLQIFPISFLVTNRIFSDKLMDRSSTAHRRLSWDLSKALMHSMGQYKNLLQVTVREVRGGSLICYADVVFQPPAPTSKDLVQVLALAVGPKNYLGASSIQVDRFSFTVAGETLEPPFASPKIPSYGIALIVLSSFALIVIPFLVLLYKHLGWKEKMVIHRVRDPEVTVETFELENPTFRSLAEENSAPSSLPPDALG
ncbi:uncharacterized protein LOC143827788 isoform X2 [Paroedura picta]|uniref:uncharacterized protein LOC143827788 isoform X2 n=1 Tax=Paroedura picta TaxID=143630 RepID=UPI00405677A6